MISTLILLLQIGTILFIKKVLYNYLEDRSKYVDSLPPNEFDTRKDDRIVGIELSILACKILIGFCVINGFVF